MPDFGQFAAEVGNLYDRHIIATGKQTQLLILVSFVLTFAGTRLTTHAIRADPFNWASDKAEATDSLHIHHSVVGIVLLLITGYVSAGIDADRYDGVVAVLFGIGAALTLDEFALWLRMKDVYWEDAGGESVNAVIIAASAMMLVIALGSLGLQF